MGIVPPPESWQRIAVLEAARAADKALLDEMQRECADAHNRIAEITAERDALRHKVAHYIDQARCWRLSERACDREYTRLNARFAVAETLLRRWAAASGQNWAWSPLSDTKAFLKRSE